MLHHIRLSISTYILGLGLGLWCLTPLSKVVQLYLGGQFYCWRKETEVPGENHQPVT
jgi:hypothetical protein